MKQKTIKLLKPHTHARRHYPVGAVLTLDADSAEWLIAIQTAEAAPARAKPDNPQEA